jgi:hypothetical protein
MVRESAKLRNEANCDIRSASASALRRLGALALKSKPSVDFSGYWQRHEKNEAAN